MALAACAAFRSMTAVNARWEIDYRNLGFWDRLEVKNAVRHGRRVDDRRLAPIAVGYARQIQQEGAGWSWSSRDSILGAVLVAHAAVAAIFLPLWLVVPVAAFLAVLAGFRYDQGGARRPTEKAEEAEEANRWVVENYELLDDRTRAQLQPRRFTAVRRLVR